MTNTVPQVEKAKYLQPELTVSIVTYNPDFNELRKTLSSLNAALAELTPDSSSITIIDNSSDDRVASFLERELQTKVKLIHGQGNIGFGRAHNLTLSDMGKYHLILNPDIQLQPDALVNALSFMQHNADCGLLTPYAVWPDGQRQYLCKRYPAAFDLLLRGFAPKSVQALFAARLTKYEMQAETQNDVFKEPPIVSGCFMLFRSSILAALGGFDDRYFLYFEDFDLSQRSQRITKTAYVPTVRVVHSGGHASKKGLWHIRQFIRSSVSFYAIHGLKLF